MILICVQPCTIYYAWQVEVMLQNFMDLGIHEKYEIRCLFAYNRKEKDWASKVSLIQKVQLKYFKVAKFYFYEDTRDYPISYISSIRPNLLKQHYLEFPDLYHSSVFYHDCDIVFTKFPDFFDGLLIDNTKWYLSNTISYIGHDYIKSKGDIVLSEMCKIVGINENLVQKNQSNSGGCQYLLSNVDWRFWHKVEKDSENLFRDITKLNHVLKADNPSYHEVQIWCADMWAVLWNAWIRGFETEIIESLSFSWATDNIDTWDKKYIYHNAGVNEGMKMTHFYKYNFRDILPYEFECETFDTSKAVYNYWRIIKKIGKNSCLYE